MRESREILEELIPDSARVSLAATQSFCVPREAFAPLPLFAPMKFDFTGGGGSVTCLRGMRVLYCSVIRK